MKFTSLKVWVRYYQGKKELIPMGKLFIIHDYRGNSYEILDINSFYRHLKEFHFNGISVHEEEGHYFTVNNDSRKKIKEMFYIIK